jgi:hypothetical protein
VEQDDLEQDDTAGMGAGSQDTQAAWEEYVKNTNLTIKICKKKIWRMYKAMNLW